MTQTRFKLPPRANTAPGAGQRAADVRPPASRQTNATMAEWPTPPFMPRWDALLATHRRNLQALLAVNEAALDGARAITRHNLEFFWLTMASLSRAAWAAPRPDPSSTP